MSRPTIGSLGYVYRPWSDDRRTAARASAIARSGALPGHRKLYGVQVPERYWPAIKPLAVDYRNRDKATLVKTQRMIRKALAAMKEK